MRSILFAAPPWFTHQDRIDYYTISPPIILNPVITLIKWKTMNQDAFSGSVSSFFQPALMKTKSRVATETMII